MEWNGSSDKYFTTSNTGHRICITFHSGEKKYTAWPAKPKPDSLPLAVCKSLEAAQKICEDDFKQPKQEQHNV